MKKEQMVCVSCLNYAAHRICRLCPEPRILPVQKSSKEHWCVQGQWEEIVNIPKRSGPYEHSLSYYDQERVIRRWGEWEEEKTE